MTPEHLADVAPLTRDLYEVAKKHQRPIAVVIFAPDSATTLLVGVPPGSEADAYKHAGLAMAQMYAKAAAAEAAQDKAAAAGEKH